MPTTNVQSHPVVSVTSYGAKGDGAQDDTGAIIAALAAAAKASSGGVLYFPAGTYVVNPKSVKPGGGDIIMFDLPSDITLCGEGRGSVVKVAGDAGKYTAVFGSSKPRPANIAFRDLSIDQNPGRLVGVRPDKYGNYYIPLYAILLYDCDNFTVDRCNFLHCGANAIYVGGYYANSVRVTNSKFHFEPLALFGTDRQRHGYDNSSVYVHSRDHVVSGNTFTAPWPPARAVKVGDRYESYNVGGAIETHRGPSLVTGNLIEGFFVGVNAVGGDAGRAPADPTDEPNGLRIFGNTMRSVNTGVALWASPGYTLRGVQVVGNTIEVANNDWCDAAAGGNSSAGVSLHVPPQGEGFGSYEDITVSDNMIHFQSPPRPEIQDADYGTYGVGLSSPAAVSRAVVANNVIVNSPCKGVDVSKLPGAPPESGQALDVRIIGNMVYNAGCDQSLAQGENRAAISSNHRRLSHCLVSGNHIMFPSKTAAYSLHFETAVPSEGVYVYGNRVTAPEAPAFVLKGPGLGEEPF